MTPRALWDLAREQGMPAYRGRQIAEWLYHKHIDSIDEMTSLSKADRARLSEEFHVGRGEPVARRVSRDGTVKYAFAVAGHSGNAGRSGPAGRRSAQSGHSENDGPHRDRKSVV